MLDLKQQKDFIRKVAASDATVLIQGSTGTGKTYLASKLHELSLRKNAIFVPINLATINENLLESELFGHEKGSFSGAFNKRLGRLELARGGTVFLDEVGELSLRSQVRLLEILNSRKLIPVGSNREIKLDIRIIVATNKNIAKMVKEGSFRPDLYYRLNTFSIEVPKLKDRVEAIPFYVEKFLREYEEKNNKSKVMYHSNFMNILQIHDWPGNLRELKNVIEYARILCEDKELALNHLPEYFFFSKSKKEFGIKQIPINFYEAKAKFERSFLEQALYRFDGKINLTARETKLSKVTIIGKIRRYNIDVEEIRSKNCEKRSEPVS